MKMKFKLPILDILDEMQSKAAPGKTLLDEVVLHLYVDSEMPVHTIAALLGIGEATIQARIPKDKKRKEVMRREIEEISGKVKAEFANGKVPKEIAYDYDISVGQVYAILKRK